MDTTTSTIKEALDLFHDPGDVVELRIPKAGRYKTVAGYFDDFQHAAEAAVKWSGQVDSVYFSLNQVDPACLARYANRLENYADTLTTDSNIIQRRWFLIDCDPTRPAGVSSTDAEHKSSFAVGRAIREFLDAAGWPEPIRCDSGNGAHLHYALDLANDNASSTILQNCLEALALHFDTDVVKIDTTTWNASRVCKLYGTLAGKGDSIPERPHRIARILGRPETIKPVTRTQLEALAASLPKDEKQRMGRVTGHGDALDVEEWLRKYGVDVRYSTEYAGRIGRGKRYILEACPWNAEHTNGAAYVIQFESGAIAAGCHHNGCAGRTWKDLRDLFEPNRGQSTNRTISSGFSSNGQPASEPGKLPRRSLSDLGNAERLIDRHGLDLRWCDPWAKWLVWDGARWKVDDTRAIHRKAKDTVRRIYAEAGEADDPKDREEIASHAGKSESNQRINAMLERARADVAILPDDLDTDPWLFNVQNGTIDLRTGTIRPHNRTDLITKVAPFNHDSEATCPNFLDFVAQIMDGDQALIDFLQRVFGYALSGSIREQVMFIFNGLGANGKSTLLDLFLATTGDYGSQTPTDTLMVKRGESIPNDIARLRGTRLVTAVESEDGRRLSESLVKQMTGGDRMTARFMRAEWFEFKPQFKVILGTNHKPTIKGTDHAIWRRIRLVPFKVTIPDAKQDKDLVEKLRAELPGIFNWALAGCLAWQRDGLAMPAAVSAATANYRAESDILAGWMTDCCVIDPTATETAKALYESYVQWCQDAEENSVTQRTFGTRLTERGFDRFKGTGNIGMWLGIALKRDQNGSQDSEELPNEETEKRDSDAENDQVSYPSYPENRINSLDFSSKPLSRNQGNLGNLGNSAAEEPPPGPGNPDDTLSDLEAAFPHSNGVVRCSHPECEAVLDAPSLRVFGVCTNHMTPEQYDRWLPMKHEYEVQA